MAIPEFDADGYLPPGIHAASLGEVGGRFGTANPARVRQFALLSEVVNASRRYLAIKRVLAWGSFVTVKFEPADLDYSIVAGVGHRERDIRTEHRRLLTGGGARRYYGADRSYLVVFDYPIEGYADKLEFLTQRRDAGPRGIIEVSLRGESAGANDESY